MKIAILGSGAVGGYYGARLARAGHDVTFIARGAHLAAIRERGLEIQSAALGDFVARGAGRGGHGEGRAGRSRAGRGQGLRQPDGAAAAARRCSATTPSVLTVQNGVDSAGEVAAVAGEARTLGGTTYIATALEAPGLIVQTGTHRRIVFGEVVRRSAARERARPRGSTRRSPAPTSSRSRSATAACRSGRSSCSSPRSPASPARRGCRSDRCGAIPSRRRSSSPAAARSRRVARAEGVPVAADVVDRIVPYIDAIPGTMRSSLLIDLQQGKRIEVEALQGTVVRRGAARGVPTPIMSTLYSVLKLHAAGISALDFTHEEATDRVLAA